jgi:hypothetical protein
MSAPARLLVKRRASDDRRTSTKPGLARFICVTLWATELGSPASILNNSRILKEQKSSYHNSKFIDYNSPNFRSWEILEIKAYFLYITTTGTEVG